MTKIDGPAVADGWQLVPKELTQEMLDANFQPMSTNDWWKATLAAAPQPVAVVPDAYMYVIVRKGCLTRFAAIEYHEQEGERILSATPLYFHAPIEQDKEKGK